MTRYLHRNAEVEAKKSGDLETLSAAELNKRFYEELSNWFAWASTIAPVAFPKGQRDRKAGTNRIIVDLDPVKISTRFAS